MTAAQAKDQLAELDDIATDHFCRYGRYYGRAGYGVRWDGRLFRAAEPREVVEAIIAHELDK